MIHQSLAARVTDSVLKLSLLLILLALGAPAVRAGYIVTDAIRAGENIRFHWTRNDELLNTTFRYNYRVDGVSGVGSSQSGSTLDWNRDRPSFAGLATSFEFFAPSLATDWHQEIISATGTSQVYAGNIKKDSPWAFHELDLLPPIETRIPDLAPTAGSPSTTIYTAVNLGLYMASNPDGFLNGAWSPGQTLSELGLTITDGEILGLQGIYWSTTPFEFNPDPNGRGFTPLGGDGNLLDSATYGQDIVILAQHTTTFVPVPEPSSIALISCGTVILTYLGRRRRMA